MRELSDDPGTTCVTATHRLARYLLEEHAAARLAAGHRAWRTPDVLPRDAWLRRLWEECLLDAADGSLPRLLHPEQDLAAWEELIARSLRDGEADRAELWQVTATARGAREAWHRLCAWQRRPEDIDGPLGDDAAAFAGWARRYRDRLARDGLVDGAMLPAALLEPVRAGRLPLPRRLVLAGFDDLVPAQRALLEALAGAGVEVETASAVAPMREQCRVAAPDPAAEIAAAAEWARALLEADPGSRIGVVVPDLAHRREEVIRVFCATLEPDTALAPADDPPRTFHVSLGPALADVPVADAALRLLRLVVGTVTVESAGVLLRSPFLPGWEPEGDARLRLDVTLRERGAGELDAASLARQARARGCPVLADALEGAAASVSGGSAPPSRWAERFSAAMAQAGWPGERSLTSAEHQAAHAWRETLAALRRLDDVVAPCSAARALARLSRLAAERIHQPRGRPAPVQVLGMQEAAGMTFTHLRITGLHDAAWPPAPRPVPFLPVRLQRAWGMPEADAALSLERSRAVLSRLLASAPTVVVSHPRRDGDEVLRPSRLIMHLRSLGADESPASGGRLAGWVHAAAPPLEEVDDGRGPALAAGEAAGGAGLLRDQSACPFRAYARWRLNAAAVPEPVPQPDPRIRGIMMHEALASVWAELGSREALAALEPPAREALVARHVDAALDKALERGWARLPRPVAGLEARRMRELLDQWLQRERERGPFTVEASEERATFGIGELALHMRLDRLDRLPDGRAGIIDYKTGRARVGDWEGERPAEPQLPAYAVGLDARGDAPAFVAFAQLRRGEMAWRGLAAPGAAVADGVRELDADAWARQLEDWRHALAGLAAAFVAGEAAVDPRDPGECRGCDVQPLCRVWEQPAPGAETEEGDD